MKEWKVPVIEELNVSETAYGGENTQALDNLYRDEEGNWAWTFEGPDNPIARS